MLDPGYKFSKIRKMISNEFRAGFEKEQALLRLTESEMWLSHARPKNEPFTRTAIEENPGEFHDSATMDRVLKALMETGLTSERAADAIEAMQSRGVMFRELAKPERDRFND